MPAIRRTGHHYSKGLYNIAVKIAEEPWVEKVEDDFFEPTTNTRVKPLFDGRGTILVLWADNEKASRLRVRTTAKDDPPKVYKVAARIREIVEG